MNGEVETVVGYTEVVREKPRAPKISVIVPVYKAEKYLQKCVDSILGQTFRDFELLLIDDGSPDGSGAICDEYAKKDSRVRVFHKENGGVSSARNKGIDEAKGEWISFLDADDYWTESHLSDTIELMRLFPQCGLYATARWNDYPQNKRSKILFCAPVFDANVRLDEPELFTPYLLTSTVTVSAKAIAEVGAFRLRVKIGEDVDLWIRIMSRFDVAYCRKPSVIYRVESENSSSVGNLLEGQFPYWEWYEYQTPRRFLLNFKASHYLFGCLRYAIRYRDIKKTFFYIEKIKWGTLFFGYLRLKKLRKDSNERR